MSAFTDYVKTFFTKDALGSYARHALTFVGGLVVSDGLATADQETQLVGAATTAAGILWAIYQKYKAPK